MGNFLSVEQQRKHPRQYRQRYVPDLGTATPSTAVITGPIIPSAT
jgi:hypothetical protein